MNDYALIASQVPHKPGPPASAPEGSASDIAAASGTTLPAASASARLAAIAGGETVSLLTVTKLPADMRTADAVGAGAEEAALPLGPTPWGLCRRGMDECATK